MGLSLYAPPADEPVSLSQAKKQCEIDPDETEHDAFLRDLAIPAARERCEDATWRQVMPATWELTLCEFPSCGYIELPRPPLVSVVSVGYVDSSGVTQVFSPSSYSVQVPSGPRCARGRVTLGYGLTWPVTRAVTNAVTVRFTAGYADEDAVPARLKMAMLRDVAALFENRENVTLEAKGSAVELPDGSAQVYKAYRSRGTQAF